MQNITISSLNFDNQTEDESEWCPARFNPRILRQQEDGRPQHSAI